MIRTMIAAAGLLVAAALANADEISAHTADAEIYSTGDITGTQAGGTSYQVGINGGILRSIVMPFALPPRPEGAVVIESARLVLEATRIASTSFIGVDLYGLTPRIEPTVPTSDYFSGTLDERDGVTLLQNDFMSNDNTPSNFQVTVETSMAGSGALAAYMNDAYDSIGEGGYVFLRLSLDNPSAPNLDFYLVNASEFYLLFPPPTELLPKIVFEFAEIAACPADFNGDGIVDGSDLATLLSNWGSGAGVADLTGDDVVDGADLASLLSTWGMCDS